MHIPCRLGVPRTEETTILLNSCHILVPRVARKERGYVTLPCWGPYNRKETKRIRIPCRMGVRGEIKQVKTVAVLWCPQLCRA